MRLKWETAEQMAANEERAAEYVATPGGFNAFVISLLQHNPLVYTVDDISAIIKLLKLLMNVENGDDVSVDDQLHSMDNIPFINTSISELEAA